MENKWQTRFKHHRDYRDLCVKLGFCTPPKHPDGEFGTLASAGPVRSFSGVKFFPEWKILGHSSIDFDNCDCSRRT